MLHYGGHSGTLEVRAAGDGGARLSGRFPYSMRAVLSDRGGQRREEQFAPRAFAARIDDPEADILLLSQHEFARPLASRKAGTLSIRDGADGVTFEATIAPEVAGTSHGRDALALLSAGLANGLSPGFMVPPDGARVTQEAGALVRTITSAALFEMSVVTQPAYPEAQVEARSWSPAPDAPRAIARALNRWRP